MFVLEQSFRHDVNALTGGRGRGLCVVAVMMVVVGVVMIMMATRRRKLGRVCGGRVVAIVSENDLLLVKAAVSGKGAGRFRGVGLRGGASLLVRGGAGFIGGGRR